MKVSQPPPLSRDLTTTTAVSCTGSRSVSQCTVCITCNQSSRGSSCVRLCYLLRRSYRGGFRKETSRLIPNERDKNVVAGPRVLSARQRALAAGLHAGSPSQRSARRGAVLHGRKKRDESLSDECLLHRQAVVGLAGE